MKTEKGITRRKSRFWNGSILVALFAAITVFATMLQLEKNMLTQYEKGSIYVATKEIPKGQIIRKDNWEQYMVEKELDRAVIPRTALGNPEQIQNMAALYGIEEGVLLTQGMFETQEEITAEMQAPVIAGFKAEDMYQVAGGILRAGDRVHIYNVSQEGMATLVWKDVYVNQVFDASGKSISNADTSSVAQRLNVYMDSADVEKFYSELETGSLRVVKVCE